VAGILNRPGVHKHRTALWESYTQMCGSEPFDSEHLPELFALHLFCL